MLRKAKSIHIVHIAQRTKAMRVHIVSRVPPVTDERRSWELPSYTGKNWRKHCPSVSIEKAAWPGYKSIVSGQYIAEASGILPVGPRGKKTEMTVAVGSRPCTISLMR